jgi:two-component system osmolarity sensor histidine kinase EnvZ
MSFMKRLSDSIYFHLALVLLIAMGASFATMYSLFLSHLENSRNNYFAHSLVAQVRLIEEILRTRPAAEISPIEGIRISSTAPPFDQSTSISHQRITFLKDQLDEELHRDVNIAPAKTPAPGMWISLNTPDNQRLWAFIPTPNREVSSSVPLERALLVGFAIFFAGGMGLLWHIQRPLKHLGKALEQIGQSHQLTTLPVSGAGEIRILTERYNEMVKRLHRYEEERTTMLAGVAHDLRTPITRLRLLIELAQNPRSSEILHNLNDIEHITEQFLDYARGHNEEPLTEVDLAVFAEEVTIPYAGQGVTCHNEQESIIASVRGNSLRRALVNLIENAITYGRPPVTVRTSRTHEQITLAVEDSGDGIDENQIERALHPFSRLDPSRGGKGHCGLGLVIAAKIAEEHHGSLELSNRSTGGLAAAIRLPLQTQAAGHAR